MKKRLSRIVSGLAAICALGFVTGASAQATWNTSATFDFGTGTGTCDTPSCIAGGTTANVSGFGSSGGNYVAGTVTNQGGAGLGFTSSGETTNQPDHAFDNRGGIVSGTNYGASNEMLLVSFSAKVNLTGVTLGWNSGDSDVSVLRWDGAGAPTLTSTGGPSGLAGAGWTLVSSQDVEYQSGQPTFLTKDGVGYNTNSDAKVSSYWLISTYFGASSGALESGDDFFKILSFTGRTCSKTVSNTNVCGGSNAPGIPEPASLALVGLALAGVWTARRRRNARS